jgi:hypothetical protein
MVTGFDAASTPLTTLVIAQVDSVTVEDNVIIRFDFPVTRFARKGSKLDRLVSPLVDAAPALALDVICLRSIDRCLHQLVRRLHLSATSRVGVVT